MFGTFGKHLREVFHELTSHKESQIVKGHLMSDHIHIGVSIPSKCEMSSKA